MDKLFRNLLYLVFLVSFFSANAAEKPNIVYIICDDLGYGDIQCLAPDTSKIPTPHADKLASEGMIFTDAHSGSSVCSPTRYGIMTGRYSWRTRLQKGVVTGFAPSLIDKTRPTVAGFLKSQGYTTGVIGKWHLDFEYIDPNSGERYSKTKHKTPPVGARIPDGPVHRGFDYYHGFHHARNMEAVIENDKVIEHDKVINMLPRLTKKSVEFIERHAGESKPFFLYLPLGSPHTPIVPTPEWEGKSGLGKYGDFVMQTDNVVGEVTAALEKHGIADNTLVIFTSDNGCSKAAGIPGLAAKGHQVSAHLRGSKADIWDGGHRIPFIVRWPGKIKPGTTSDQLICLTDLFATTADITGEKIPAGSCEDSVSFLPALTGSAIESSRAGVIHHSISGHFAYRQGKWKLALAKASGGWSSPKESNAGTDAPKAQLYDMLSDPGEEKNLFLEKPEVARKLLAQLQKEIESGRSTEGAESKNDVDGIVLWKSEKTTTKPKKKGPERSEAKETAEPDVAAWLDAALAGKPFPKPEKGDKLGRDDIQAQEAFLWKTYADAAKRAGWAKELLGVPTSVEKMIKTGKLEIKAGELKSGDKTMPYTLMARGEKPASGWPLFISMHGGGKHHGKEKIEAHGWNVNSREWQTQMQLTAKVYKPTGLYFIPRMADDRMGRWKHKHNIDIFTRMIRRAILFNEVDPNRVYIMGISQGGYGTCHLAPLLADHFAAAGPMAGGMMTVTENLRNLPFRSDIGEFDTAYNRIELAEKLHARIDSHKKEDPEGYENLLAIQKGKGHGIDYSKSPDWLAKHTRNPYPEKIVWRCHDKDGIYRDSFYWISLTKTPEKGEFSIVATLYKDKNGVKIKAEEIIPSEIKDEDPVRRPLEASEIVVHLNDKMLDLDKRVAVQLNGNTVFNGMVERSRSTMLRNLVKRGDVNYAFPAEVIVGQE